MAGLAGALVLAAVGLAGCGSSAPSRPSRPQADHFLTVDSSARTARLAIVLGYDEEASMFNIDGAIKGALMFAVPVGWKVAFECEDRLKTARHACGLAPAPGTAAAQPGLTFVAHPGAGLSASQRATFGFTATRAGHYRIVALARSGAAWGPVPGMWVVLRVSSGGTPQARWLR